MHERNPQVGMIRIGDEIINLANVVRVERSASDDGQFTVLIYSVGDDRSDSRFSGAQAEAIWQRFSGLAETWDVPGPQRTSPAGPGRIDRPT